MDTQNVIAHAEAQIKIAKLAAALGLATSCQVRKPEGASGLSNHREVVLVVRHDTDADTLVAAIRDAAK